MNPQIGRLGTGTPIEMSWLAPAPFRLNFLVRLACCLTLALLFGSQAQGRTFVIKNPQDSIKESSLRGAILAANKLGGNNLIILAKGYYQLTIPGAGEDAGRTGDLDISKGHLTIMGLSSAKVTISASGLGDRVFHVLRGAKLILCQVTISGGASFGGENGGGILNAGQLLLKHCAVNSNSTTTAAGNILAGGSGGNGAGIYNTGTLTLCDCTVGDNFTGVGGRGHPATSISDRPEPGGKGGDGGGVFNTGKLILNDSTLSGNITGAGGGGGGGFFYMIDPYWFYVTESGNGGGAGDGAGIYNTGDLTLNTCTVSGNVNGTGGGGGFGGGGNGGNGGIYNTGSLTMKSSTVTQNSSGEGGLGLGTFGDFGHGRGGDGGVVNTTNGSHATLQNSLIAGNIPGNGFGVVFCDGSGCWPPSPAPDLTGAFSSHGYNLIGQGSGNFGGFIPPGGGTGFTNGINGDLVGASTAPIDPLLGPLQNNGGLTFTHALLPGSPAIDQGKSFGLTADQRGRLRPHDYPSILNATGGNGADIGAFELHLSVFAASPSTTLTLVAVDIRPSLGSPAYSTNGQFQFQLTGQVGSKYVVQASSDLTTWIPIATNVIPGSGFISFADPFATNFSQRFYRAMLP